MPAHFIFEDPDREQLRQGDVLRRTPELVSLLAKYHPHYATKASYPYFIVLTQTCDLIHRDSALPKSPYITIAAVRPLQVAITREAESHQNWWQKDGGAINDEIYEKLFLFMERLLNNNEPRYFYLHEDASLSITPKVCAFLALSVALKIEHMQLCLDAKVAQLESSFRAKLGWLVGNMYGRIGTKDWDQHYGAGSWQSLAKRILKDRSLFVVLPADKIQVGLAELQEVKPLEEYSASEITERIAHTRVVKKAEKFDEHAKRALREEKFVDKICGNLRRQIAKQPEIANLVAEYLRKEHQLKESEIDQAIQQILGAVPRILDRSLRDELFAEKEAVIDRIVRAIRTDAGVAQLLR
jgi:hypothetical protein